MSAPFVWYELMTTDPAAAARFYGAVVGWRAQDAGMPGTPYSFFCAGDTRIAGLMALAPEAAAAGAPPAWIGYVGVDDVDACATRMLAAGATACHPAQDIPGVGRFAVMADPDGAVLCLFTPTTMQPPAPLPAGAPGTIGWHELYAGDGARAWAFYHQQFGWEKDDAIDMGPMGVYQLFRAGAAERNGGMMTRPPQMPVAAWLYYFNVEAIDSAVARVAAAGGKVVSGPMEVPGGRWIAQAIDPQGAMFALVAPKR